MCVFLDEEGRDLCSVVIFPRPYEAIIHEQSVMWLKKKRKKGRK